MIRQYETVNKWSNTVIRQYRHNRQVVHLSALTSRPWLTCFNPGITATLSFYHWSCCPRWCSSFRRHCSFVSYSGSSFVLLRDTYCTYYTLQPPVTRRLGGRTKYVSSHVFLPSIYKKRSLSQKWHTWQLPNQPASFIQLEASPDLLYARSCTHTWNTTPSAIIRHYMQVHTYDILRQNCAHRVYIMRVTIIDTRQENT